MTQLDLPPISLARYLDLLKRRKWQVVPVSLLGMIVGALIAASVPRYYVAETEVHFNAEHLVTPQQRSLVDPLEELLANARPMVLNQVPYVLQELGWREYATDDPYARAEFIADVRSRIAVLDLGSEKRNRVFTNLKITYRDTDGTRAADFTNALRERWIEKQIADLERAGKEQVNAVLQRLNEARDALATARRDRAGFEAQNRLDPQVPTDAQNQVDRTISARIAELRARVEDLELEIADVTSALELRRQQEGQLPKRVKAPPPAIDPVLQQELLVLSARAQALRLERDIFNPGTPERRERERRLALLEAELAAKTPVPEETSIPNPEFIALQGEIDQLEHRLRALDARRKDLHAQIEANEQELARRALVLPIYREKVEAEERAAQRVNALEAELDTVTKHVQLVRSSRPFDTWSEATIPPRPTEPNITVLALIGSLIGLGIAVGLIFALDAMRFTFKTLDDLERSLPIPVLGGVSHIETVEQRTQTRRSRIVISGFAFLFLFLIVAIVTIYYAQPARLPVWARDILDLVLGGD